MTTRAILRWETPPPRPPRNAAAAAALTESPPVWQPVITDLQLRPGEWAVVHEGPTAHQESTIAWRIRNGLTRGFTAGDYEAETRKTGRGYAVYVRYVGGDDG